MKTRTDKTFSTIIIAYGLTFIIPLLILSNFKLTTISILWISFCIFIILCGIWKIESFTITDSVITKANFLGLFKKTINLENIIRCDKKVVDTDHFKNPLNVVKFFSNNKKYLTFRQITIVSEGKTKMRIDERTIYTEDFNKLIDKVKKHKNKVKQ